MNFFSNEAPRSFRWGNNQIPKCTDKLKNRSLQKHYANLTKFGIKNPKVKGIYVAQMTDHALFQGDTIGKQRKYIDEI